MCTLFAAFWILKEEACLMSQNGLYLSNYTQNRGVKVMKLLRGPAVTQKTIIHIFE